ncbi:unnamed protein product [Cylicostephanus goldi]|uniref:Uncharacterized protein n=1 Tax=Cylicostephanus goldi TaxID=71465 RepID=A0A3P7N230_CYLGO|nr:unnamed protein product [Cylicostephanus goldi]
MAIVLRLCGSNRGNERKAEIRTLNGNILKRPLSRLYPLEIRAQDDYARRVEHRRTLYKRKTSTSPTRIQPLRKANFYPHVHAIVETGQSQAVSTDDVASTAHFVL